MTKPKRVSNSAFDRWFTDTYGKPPTDAQMQKLYRAKARAEAALEIARARVDCALDVVLDYESCKTAWEAAREAGNE